MFTRLSQITLLSLAVCLLAAGSAAADDLRFTGDKTGHTDTFTMDSPWLLDWSARSPSRLPCNYEIWTKDGAKGLPCNFELRLYDADTNEYLGTIAQLEGEGRGLKLFEKAGRYRIDIVSQEVLWELLVKPIDAERAAKLKALTDKGPSLEDRSKVAAREVAANSFTSWRPDDESALLLFAEDKATGYRITFTAPCTGLTNATALSFVTSNLGAGTYDSILLDDGTQCHFDSVIPTVFD